MHRVVLLRSNPVNPDPPVEKVADALLESGIQVTVLGWDRSENEDSCSDAQLRNGTAQTVRFGIPAAYGAGWATWLSLLKFEWKLASWLVRNRMDYSMIHAFDLDTGLAAWFVGKLFKKKLIYHVLDLYSASHFFSDSLVKRMVHWVEMKLIDRADAVLICTEERIAQIRESSPEKLEVIHNTPDHAVADQCENFKLQESKAEIKIAYVGTQCGGRGIEELLDVVGQDPRFELHIGGYGPLDDAIRSAAEQCGRIHYYGRLSYANTLFLEQHCDLMVALYDPQVSNHRYTAPNKLYEALMLGKPLMMCENTGWDALFQNEEIGVLIPYSREGIIHGLDTLYKNKDRWPEMSETGKRLYQERYSWDTMKKRLWDIYSELV